MQIASLVAVAFLLVGCAYTPKTVEPAVSLQAPRISVGQGSKLVIIVVDERTDVQIGNRGYTPGAAVTVSGDLAAVVRTAVADALVAGGFALEATSPVALRIELRGLSYAEHDKGFTIGHRAVATLKAVVLNDSRQVYENLYRHEQETAGLAAAPGGTISRHVNGALTGALNRMLEDPALIAALVRVSLDS